MNTLSCNSNDFLLCLVLLLFIYLSHHSRGCEGFGVGFFIMLVGIRRFLCALVDLLIMLQVFVRG